MSLYRVVFFRLLTGRNSFAIVLTNGRTLRLPPVSLRQIGNREVLRICRRLLCVSPLWSTGLFVTHPLNNLLPPLTIVLYVLTLAPLLRITLGDSDIARPTTTLVESPL